MPLLPCDEVFEPKAKGRPPLNKKSATPVRAAALGSADRGGSAARSAQQLFQQRGI